jgi:hypothetical protein
MSSRIVVSTVLVISLWAASAACAQDRGEIADIRAQLKALEARLQALEQQSSAVQQPTPAVDRLLVLEKQLEVSRPRPGSIRSTDHPVTSDTKLVGGQILQVEWGGNWWACRIVRLLDGGDVTIHYAGWESKYDEVVPRSRLQLDPDAITAALDGADEPVIVVPLVTAPSPAVAPAESDNGPITPSDRLVDDEADLAIGAHVQVEWKGNWWRGEVMQVLDDGTVLIHYTGWGDNWDEVVPRSRLRLPSGE